jgi:uncharacterized membrane protein YcaP (DUF421 family)
MHKKHDAAKNSLRGSVMLKEVFKVMLTAFISLIVLFILTKMMGKRQISQMSMFDYIVGITIGSLGADFAIAPEDEFSTSALRW